MKRQIQGAAVAAAPFLIGSAAHAQQVSVTDGSGEINFRNVTGSFIVESDGSGSIHATDIRGSVTVQNDGSGGIEVNKVGRDFKVESKLS